MDAVESASIPGDSALATLSCIDDDAVGATLTVLWDAEPDAALVEVLVEMGERAEEMLRVALDSFAHRDQAAAESLVDLDELIDRANRRFVERLVDVMAEPALREWGLRMVVVARTIERVGDRAVDIGEQTAYLLTGEFREFTDASHPA